MGEQAFETSFIDLQKYEIVPEEIPQNETPHQFVLRMTGIDFTGLENVSWEYVREYPPMSEWLNHVITIFYKPRIVIREKRALRTEARWNYK